MLGRHYFKRMIAALVGLLACACADARTLEAGPESLVAQLARLRAGDVLLLEPGVYRTTLTLRRLEGTAEAPITVRGDVARGRVIFRGSDVLADWRTVEEGVFAHRMDREPSQLFVDGTPLLQMGGTVFDGYPVNPKSAYKNLHAHEGGIWPGRREARSRADLLPESFFYSAQDHLLFVKTARDLRTVMVEASQRPHGVFAADVRHVVIEDLEVQHANTSVTGRGGAFVVWGDFVNIRRVVASWNDLAGLQVGGHHIALEDAVASYNGQLGVTARGSLNRIARVKAIRNNRRSFNKWWEAGGFKFIGELNAGLSDSSVLDCQAISNDGDGIWLDWKNKRVEVSRNLSAYNTGFGIHYEVSSQGLIQDNVVLGNGQRGIYLSSSDQTRVLNNLVLGNALEGIVSIWDRTRRDEAGVSFAGAGNVMDGNVIAYNNQGAITVPSDSGALSNRNVFWGDGAESRFSVDFPSPLNQPSYGLLAWTSRVGLDDQSWWHNRPRSSPWRGYLAAKSTELAPLRQLVLESRAAPPNEGAIIGKGWLPLSGGASTGGVGPRHWSDMK